jgi:hypothetical protein
LLLRWHISTEMNVLYFRAADCLLVLNMVKPPLEAIINLELNGVGSKHVSGGCSYPLQSYPIFFH